MGPDEKLDEQASQRMFHQTHSIWVEPELRRRRERGELPLDFQIRRCLILFPQEKAPIVHFNEEVPWDGFVKLTPSAKLEPGDSVFLSQVERIENVNPPEVDGKRVAFIYLYPSWQGWKLVWDATPNFPDMDVKASGTEDWEIGRIIAASLNQNLTDRVVAFHDTVKDSTRAIGLWAVPSLVPNPLAAIADKCAAGDLDGAKKLLIGHCTDDFLRHRVDTWGTNELFRRRDDVFKEAIWAHATRKYALSVSALMPQVEGVVTEWIHGQAPGTQVPRKEISKLKKMEEIVMAKYKMSLTDSLIVRSFVDFMVGGPMLSTFNDWFGPLLDPFPNRHAIAHGRFIADYFSEENSIKVFLLLDTFYALISDKEQ